ncbi:hypothetical protein ACQUY5_16555 [Bacillus cereus]|uniref:hypothetical protein n=1 Tax=Bacillus cereus TaxID=1396 RepID=UPI003D17D059
MENKNLIKVEYLYEKEFYENRLGLKQEVKESKPVFKQARMVHSEEGELLVTSDKTKMEELIDVLGLTNLGTCVELNYPTEDKLYGVLMYQPNMEVVFETFGLGESNNPIEGKELVGVVGHEFATHFVSVKEGKTVVYKPDLTLESNKVEMREKFLTFPTKLDSLVLYSKEEDYLLESVKINL